MDKQFDEIVNILATTQKSVCVTAAAGCGKTTAIAKAVEQCHGKQLILTHTNAGVAALRVKLRKSGIQESKFHVDTIASWFLRYAVSYREMSAISNPRPIGNEWDSVYPAVSQLFDYSFIQDVICSTYSGIFVDEYQDCSLEQHQIILKMAQFLPVKVLGDPLQGIFDFQGTPIKWRQDVVSAFNPLPDLCFPHRWKSVPNANQVLGEQIGEIRQRLLAHQPINLQDYSQITWFPWSDKQETEICYQQARKHAGGAEQIIGIQASGKEKLDHALARQLQGTFQCIEEMECRELMDTAKRIDKRLNAGNYSAIKNEIKTLILHGCGNRAPFDIYSFEDEFSCLEQGDLLVIAQIMEKILKERKFHVYRRELFQETRRAILEFMTGKYPTMEEAAWQARYKTRINGKRIDEKRIISRLLLIKGLEFDHAIVMNADSLGTAPKFYVAITRGAKSLTVLSEKPVLQFSN